MKVLIAAGGTGGHIYPGIYLADFIKNNYENSEILFVGTEKGLEKDIIPRHNYKLELISAKPLSRKLNLELIKWPFSFFKSNYEVMNLLKKFKPDLVIGTGGYVSGAVFIASSIKGIKTIMKEQDSKPGVANRLLSSFADVVFIAFEESAKYIQNKNTVLIGNPIRNMEKPDMEVAKNKFGFNKDDKVIFIFGGSLGAEGINRIIVDGIKEKKFDEYKLIWQVGKKNYEKYSHFNSNEIKVFPYIDDMGSCYSAGDIIISRAGAMTISELAYFKKATIFIPYPYAAHNHQVLNAKVIVDKDAALMIEEKDITLEKITNLIKIAFEKRDILSKNIEKFYQYNCEDIIKNTIDNLLKK